MIFIVLLVDQSSRGSAVRVRYGVLLLQWRRGNIIAHFLALLVMHTTHKTDPIDPIAQLGSSVQARYIDFFPARSQECGAINAVILSQVDSCGRAECQARQGRA